MCVMYCTCVIPLQLIQQLSPKMMAAEACSRPENKLKNRYANIIACKFNAEDFFSLQLFMDVCSKTGRGAKEST